MVLQQNKAFSSPDQLVLQSKNPETGSSFQAKCVIFCVFNCLLKRVQLQNAGFFDRKIRLESKFLCIVGTNLSPSTKCLLEK